MSKENNTATQEKNMCSKKEVLAPVIGVLGHDSAYTLWHQWITPFLTDIMQLPAAFLTVMLAACRIFDGVNDIAMGFLADKTKSKHGRYRPWVLYAGPLFCVCMALSFLLPGNNMMVRIIYATVMYVVVDVVFTAVDIPFWSLPAAMTSNTGERGRIIGIVTTVSTLISTVIAIVMPTVLESFGAFKWTSYFYLAAAIAVFGIIMYLICFAMVREHVVPDPQEKFSLKLGFKNIFENKPLLLITAANLAIRLAMLVRSGFNYYYFSYNFGSLSYYSLVAMAGMATSLVGSLLFTALAKRVDKKILMISGIVLYVVPGVFYYFAGWSNFNLCLIMSIISGISTGALMVCINAMLADTIEYGEWKTGQSNAGLINSTRCFISKLTTAASGVVTMVTLAIANYAPGVEQTASTLSSFHVLYTLGACGIMLLGLIPMFFYDLTTKRHEEIKAELAARKAQN